MKGILIDNRMLLREENRIIDRNSNYLSVFLSCEPFLGKTFTQETLEQVTKISISYSKTKTPEIWNNLKDTTNAEFIDHIFCIIQEWKDVNDSIAPQPIMGTVQDPVKGIISVISGFTNATEEYLRKQEILKNHADLKPLLEMLKAYGAEVVEL